MISQKPFVILIRDLIIKDNLYFWFNSHLESWHKLPFAIFLVCIPRLDFEALLLWRWNIIVWDVNVLPYHNDFPETPKKWLLEYFIEEVSKHSRCVAVLDTELILIYTILNKTYLMEMVLELPVHESLPFFSILIAFSFSWYKTFLYRA